jgi:hypothetical protein
MLVTGLCKSRDSHPTRRFLNAAALIAGHKIGMVVDYVGNDIHTDCT